MTTGFGVLVEAARTMNPATTFALLCLIVSLSVAAYAVTRFWEETS